MRKILLAVLCLAASMLLSGCGDGTTDSDPVAPSESATNSADIEPSETASAPASDEPSESPSEGPSEPVSGQPSDSPSEELSASDDAPAGDETGDAAGGETTTPEEVVLDLGEYGTVTLSGGLASDKAEFVFAEGDDYGGEPRDWFYFDVAAGSTCTITPSDVCKYTIIDLMAYTLEDGKLTSPMLRPVTLPMYPHKRTTPGQYPGRWKRVLPRAPATLLSALIRCAAVPRS